MTQHSVSSDAMQQIEQPGAWATLHLRTQKTCLCRIRKGKHTALNMLSLQPRKHWQRLCNNQCRVCWDTGQHRGKAGSKPPNLGPVCSFAQRKSWQEYSIPPVTQLANHSIVGNALARSVPCSLHAMEPAAVFSPIISNSEMENKASESTPNRVLE